MPLRQDGEVPGCILQRRRESGRRFALELRVPFQKGPCLQVVLFGFE
jgi:hypothetical protein